MAVNLHHHLHIQYKSSLFRALINFVIARIPLLLMVVKYEQLITHFCHQFAWTVLSCLCIVVGTAKTTLI